MRLRKLGTNRTQLTLDNGTEVLFSYETPVAAYIHKRGYVRTSTKYSQTTTRHINVWLGGVNAETVEQEVIRACTTGAKP